MRIISYRAHAMERKSKENPPVQTNRRINSIFRGRMLSTQLANSGYNKSPPHVQVEAKRHSGNGATRRRASRGRGELPLDRKRHRSNGRAGARPSHCPFVADAMNCVPPSAMRDGEGAIATIPARECKTAIYQLPTILKPLHFSTAKILKCLNAQMQSQIVNRKSQISD